jgi:hypothetical protein
VLLLQPESDENRFAVFVDRVMAKHCDKLLSLAENFNLMAVELTLESEQFVMYLDESGCNRVTVRFPNLDSLSEMLRQRICDLFVLKLC